MIFLTVGTQLPFERLVLAVDAWAANHPEIEFFAQVGPTTNPPRHMAWSDFVPPARANELMQRASLIVSHAGMGSVMTALRLQRPILILPRKAALGEHRNDHQLATARWLATRPGISVAWEADEIAAQLENRADLVAGPGLPEVATGPLVDRLADWIHKKAG